MTTRRYFSLIALSVLVLAGCANNQQTTTNTGSSTRTYTSDLERTGKRDAADALRSADPAVTTRQ